MKIPREQLRIRGSFLGVLFGSLLTICIILLLLANSRMTIDYRTSDLSIAKSLDLAIQNYVAEYEKLPPHSSPSFDLASPEGISVITTLLGKESTDKVMGNPRMVTYLNVRDGKGRKGGLIYDSKGNIAGIFDTWGHPFLICFPSAPDAPISLPNGDSISGKPVVIISAGPDGKFGTADDIIPAHSPPKPKSGLFDHWF